MSRVALVLSLGAMFSFGVAYGMGSGAGAALAALVCLPLCLAFLALVERGK